MLPGVSALPIRLGAAPKAVCWYIRTSCQCDDVMGSLRPRGTRARRPHPVPLGPKTGLRRPEMTQVNLAIMVVPGTGSAGHPARHCAIADRPEPYGHEAYRAEPYGAEPYGAKPYGAKP